MEKVEKVEKVEKAEEVEQVEQAEKVEEAEKFSNKVSRLGLRLPDGSVQVPPDRIVGGTRPGPTEHRLRSSWS